MGGCGVSKYLQAGLRPDGLSTCPPLCRFPMVALEKMQVLPAPVINGTDR